MFGLVTNGKGSTVYVFKNMLEANGQQLIRLHLFIETFKMNVLRVNGVAYIGLKKINPIGLTWFILCYELERN